MEFEDIRFLKLNQIEKINIPGFGEALQLSLRLATVLPWFVTRRRTLDAWVRKHRQTIKRSWELETSVSTSSFQGASPTIGSRVFISLPLRLGNPATGELIDTPGPKDFKSIIKSPRTIIQIIGAGGVGKTTLARQLGQWSFDNGPQKGVADHPILPVWIDEELSPTTNSLMTVIAGKLKAVLADQEIEDELLLALLKQQRIAVFVDRLSERSVTTQRYLETIYRSAEIGLLVLTSRNRQIFEGVESAEVYPQALNSSTLLYFMTSLLTVGVSGSSQFETVHQQLTLGERLASLITLRTEHGNEDVAIMPLTVRMFVEQAVELVRSGKDIDELPVSLPEAYFRHLILVNPRDATLPHFVDNARMIKIARVLAVVALGADFIPKEFSRQQALTGLAASGESITVSCDPIERLRLNGVLIEKASAVYVHVRFALDPVAEFLAAVAHAEECGSSESKWDTLLSKSKKAEGFHTALRVVRQAYGKREGWTTND